MKQLDLTMIYFSAIRHLSIFEGVCDPYVWGKVGRVGYSVFFFFFFSFLVIHFTIKKLLLHILQLRCLTLEAPITTAADDIHKYFLKKTKNFLIFHVRIHMKKSSLYFFRQIKVKKIKCRRLQLLFGALWLNYFC